MKALLIALVLPLGLLASAGGYAQAPAGAPAGTTGLCKDGSYTSADTKRGACRGHKGVKDWYAASTSTAAAKTDSTAAASKPAKSAASASTAAAPAAAPAGSTGLCKDGSYTTADSKRGACRGHKGVQEWYAATAPAAAKAAPAMPAPAAPPAATPPMPAAAPPMPASAPAPMPSASPAHAPARTSVPGGGAGQVWVNTESKVYHCANDRYYGKTKQGEYMTETDAIAKGNHASHGKSCAQ